MFAHLLENGVNVVGTLDHQLRAAVVRNGFIHAVAEQRIVANGDQTGRVTSVLEHFATLESEVVQEFLRVRAETRKEGHEVRADDDVD
jgi:hypothetical protein